MTILDTFSTFKSEELLANDRADATINGFWWMIRSLTDVVGNIETEDLTLEVVNEWRRFMNDRHRPTTVHTNISRFRVFADWLVEQGYCSLPLKKIKAPRRPKPNAVYLTEAEIDRMVRVATNIRDKAIIDVLFSCGLRNTECRELRREDINDRDVHVRHGVKNDDNRYVFLSKRAHKHLQMYLQSRVDRSAYLFVTRDGKKIANSTFRYIIKCVGERAGIDPVKCHPHAARHGCGTLLMEKNMHMRGIQEYLGHAYITTTQIYTHPERANLRAAHEEIFDGKKPDDPKLLRQQIAELQRKLRSTHVTKKIVKDGDRTSVEYRIPENFDHKAARQRFDTTMRESVLAVT